MPKATVGAILGGLIVMTGAANAETRIIYPPYTYQPAPSLSEFADVIYGNCQYNTGNQTVVFVDRNPYLSETADARINRARMIRYLAYGRVSELPAY